MRAARQKGKEHERDKRYSHLFQKGIKLHGKGAGRYAARRQEDTPAALVPLSAWEHLSNTHLVWECDTYSCTALAMESAVDPVSLTLSKVTFGRSSSSLSLLICLGDRPRGSICAGKRHIMD